MAEVCDRIMEWQRRQNGMKTMRVMRMKLPSQEVILVWVFVKHFHFQLLTRYFMDNHLTHTHTRAHTDKYTKT